MNGGKCREEGSSKSEEERGTEAVSRGNIFFFFFFVDRVVSMATEVTMVRLPSSTKDLSGNRF